MIATFALCTAVATAQSQNTSPEGAHDPLDPRNYEREPPLPELRSLVTLFESSLPQTLTIGTGRTPIARALQDSIDKFESCRSALFADLDSPPEQMLSGGLFIRDGGHAATSLSEKIKCYMLARRRLAVVVDAAAATLRNTKDKGAFFPFLLPEMASSLSGQSLQLNTLLAYTKATACSGVACRISKERSAAALRSIVAPLDGVRGINSTGTKMTESVGDPLRAEFRHLLALDALLVDFERRATDYDELSLELSKERLGAAKGPIGVALELWIRQLVKYPVQWRSDAPSASPAATLAAAYAAKKYLDGSKDRNAPPATGLPATVMTLSRQVERAVRSVESIDIDAESRFRSIK